MPNPHLAQMTTHVTDDDLTEAQKINKICIAFAAWAKDMRDASNALNMEEQFNELNMESLNTANKLLHSAAASTHIANMFSDSKFADDKLKKLTQMIEKHITAMNAVARFTASQGNKPLPKPPGRAATAAAATPRMFSANPAAATSASVKALPLAPKSNMK